MYPFLNNRYSSLSSSARNWVYHQETRKCNKNQAARKVAVTRWVRRRLWSIRIVRNGTVLFSRSSNGTSFCALVWVGCSGTWGKQQSMHRSSQLYWAFTGIVWNWCRFSKRRYMHPFCYNAPVQNKLGKVSGASVSVSALHLNGRKVRYTIVTVLLIQSAVRRTLGNIDALLCIVEFWLFWLILLRVKFLYVAMIGK